MRRLCALLAAAPLLLLLPAEARADDTALLAEVDRLRARAEALEGQRGVLFEREIESYLARTEAHAGAQGATGLAGITLDARLTAVALATLGGEPTNRHSVHGDVDLDFDFAVNDNLELFVHLTANNPGADFPAEFGPLAGPAGATLSGLGDGIGVDGTVSPSPGSVRVRETGVRWVTSIGSHTLHVLIGKLDPRDRFAQNRFAGDENTQFLNNLFDDPPALTWVSTAAGPTTYAFHLWMEFGEDSQWRVDFGYYNTPGQFFTKGVFYWQVAWRGELQGRELNIRAYGQIDTQPSDVSAALGVSADWLATEWIGVFARATVRDNQPFSQGERNPIESDWQIGAEFHGPFKQRPDDTAGIAWGLIKGPVSVVIPGGASENHELVIELYYRFLIEETKLQITPMVQIIVDPGAGTFGDPDDLAIIGVRVFMPF